MAELPQSQTKPHYGGKNMYFTRTFTETERCGFHAPKFISTVLKPLPTHTAKGLKIALPNGKVIGQPVIAKSTHHKLVCRHVV